MSPPRKTITKGKGKGKASKTDPEDDDEDDDRSFVESSRSSVTSGDDSGASAHSLQRRKAARLQKPRKSRGKDATTLSTAQEEELAEWYRDQTLFYMKSDPDYKNNSKKDRVDSEKDKELNLPSGFTRNWRKSMRTRYSKLTKAGPSGSGAKKDRTPRENWIISAFSFLKDHIRRVGGSELSQMQSSGEDEEVAQALDDTSQLGSAEATPQSSRPQSATFPGKKRRKTREEDSLPPNISTVVSALQGIVQSNAENVEATRKAQQQQQQQQQTSHPLVFIDLQHHLALHYDT
jgi:hypothetical protein